MSKDKLLATAYVNLIKSDGEVKFEYGYELDKLKVSLNDIGMFLSFLCTFQSRAEQEFKDRLDVQDKELSVEKN